MPGGHYQIARAHTDGVLAAGPGLARSPSTVRQSTYQLKADARAKNVLRRKSSNTGGRIMRIPVLERLHMESELLVGLRTIFLSYSLFIIMVLLLGLESKVEVRAGLKRTYESMFDLSDVWEIGTHDDVNTFIAEVSARARKLQVLSSEHLVETGELKIMEGIKTFREPETLEVAGLMPGVDAQSFTLAAWVQRTRNSEGYIVRKPLGNSRSESALSCYGWYMGDRPRFDWGAHDFDVGRSSESQESAVADGNFWSDGKMHFEAIVVNATHISFLQDVIVRSVVRITRPVTDCSGKTLLLGAALLRLGEVSFSPVSLTQGQLSEIWITGFTFENIAAGKIPYAPAETDFDALRSAQAASASSSASIQADTQESIELSSVLTQTVAGGAAQSPARASTGLLLAVAEEGGCSRRWPSCRVITGVNETLTPDPANPGLAYYELLPPSARGGAAAGSIFHVDGTELAHYDAATFPTWRGQSASFAGWVRADGMTGYLVSKHADLEEVGRCWTWHLEKDGLASIGGAVSQGWTHPNAYAFVPAHFPFHFQHRTKLRHVAQVFDKERNSMRGYLDGVLMQETVFEDPDTVGRLDCPVTNRTYIGLAHRAPGAIPYAGDLQDLRMYVGAALSDAQVLALALDERGPARRQCALAHEGSDSTYSDVNGHGCAWYQEARKTQSSICDAEEVQRNCRVACGVDELCLTKQEEAAPVHSIFERVMHIAPNAGESGVLCVREGLDVVQACRAQDRSLLVSEDTNSWYDFVKTNTPLDLQELINVTDCEILERVVNPHCSFSPGGAWTRGFEAAVAGQGGGLSVTMWIRAVSPASLVAGRLAPTIMFLSSVAPPLPVLDIRVRQSGLVMGTVFGRCRGTDREEVLLSADLATTRWVHLAVVYGLRRDGRRYMAAAVDALIDQDRAEWDWCPQPGGEFIQAVSLSNELLVSPIRFAARALSARELQTQYYEERGRFGRVRGPARTEQERAAWRVPVQQAVFSAPAALIAPAIIFQRRKVEGACGSRVGAGLQARLRQDAAQGSLCAAPFACPTHATHRPLLPCHADGLPESFFGRPPLFFFGESVFAEFLASVADASVLFREGQTFNTADFIDGHTTKLTVLVVGLSPQHGVASQLWVSIDLADSVLVDYQIYHLESQEGAELERMVAVLVVGMVCAALNLADIASKAAHTLRHDHAGETWWQALARPGPLLHELLPELVIVVLLPLSYFVARLVRALHGEEGMASAVGEGGLLGVPWASNEVDYGSKVELFVNALDRMWAQIQAEKRLSIVGFVVAIVLQLQVIYSFKCHPRTAILVRTLCKAVDDLWHFTILFMVIAVGFAAVAISRFGGDWTQFADMASTFEQLFDMMMGSLPVSGRNPIDRWSSDALVIIFVTVFNFLIFFIMLNFIIAIIVEAYLKTKKELEDDESEQEFFTDIFAVLRVVIRGRLSRWPAHSRLIHAMHALNRKTVGPEDLAPFFPSTPTPALVSVISHYHQYDFAKPRHNSAQHLDLETHKEVTIPEAIEEIEKRTLAGLAMMFNKPVPTRHAVEVYERAHATERRLQSDAMSEDAESEAECAQNHYDAHMTSYLVAGGSEALHSLSPPTEAAHATGAGNGAGPWSQTKSDPAVPIPNPPPRPNPLVGTFGRSVPASLGARPEARAERGESRPLMMASPASPASVVPGRDGELEIEISHTPISVSKQDVDGVGFTITGIGA